jgi:hypothetical protein
MKVEIDLNDILGDEYGAETMQESIKRQVIENLTTKIANGVKSKIDQEVNKQISNSVSEEVSKRMPEILDDLLNAEFTPIDIYGTRAKEATTFRKQLVKTITDEMVYNKTFYSDQKNAYTRTVDSIIEEQMKLISAEYKKTVDEAIGKQAFALAVDTLRQKLGLT